jgi:uncharacterized protein (TIGR03790 family)
LLFEDYDLESGIYNPYYGWESSGGMEDKGNMVLSQPWQPLHFQVQEPSWLPSFGWDGNGGVTRIDYLVTRLTAYTLEETLQMIDRCVNSYSGSDYYIVLDDDNKTIDRMNDPVWPGFPNDESATEVLTRLGFNLYSDSAHQSDLITAAFLGDTSISDHVLGYCSHGYHSAFDGYFILDDLGFNYLHGALFMSYESSNGTTFVWTEPHNVAGQLADFIRMGGSGGVGNVYEPYNLACGDESMMFAEYLGGRNLAEACYKGIIAISWMEVIVGDPLCTVSVE